MATGSRGMDNRLPGNGVLSCLELDSSACGRLVKVFWKILCKSSGNWMVHCWIDKSWTTGSPDMVGKFLERRLKP